MVGRGPKKPIYDEADRPFRIAGLKLMLKGLSANAAASKVRPEKMRGLGTDSKQRRLQRWLAGAASRMAEHPNWVTGERLRGRAALEWAIHQEWVTFQYERRGKIISSKNDIK